jgi:hypothetical protein
MGRTIPTATMLLMREKQAWNPFRNALDKKDCKAFDEMLSLSHVFNYAMMCSIPKHPIPIQPIFMSIIFYHYKELVRMVKKVGSEASP